MARPCRHSALHLHGTFTGSRAQQAIPLTARRGIPRSFAGARGRGNVPLMLPTRIALGALATVALASTLTLGCRRLLGGEKDDKGTARGFECSRLPQRDVEAVVGKLSKPPKDKKKGAFGEYCDYSLGQHYVYVYEPAGALYDEVAASPHAPLTAIHDPPFLHAQVTLPVDGVGDAAYLTNVTGVEHVLWTKKGTKHVAIQSTLDPSTRIEDYKKLARLALDHT